MTGRDSHHEDASGPGTCVVVEAGSVAYDAAIGLQKRLHEKVASGGLPGALLLLEHPHVFTLGRRGRTDDILVDEEQLAALGAAVRHTDRGGEVTYHGPGQLVGYPIVDLRGLAVTPLDYVRRLERVLIATLADFGIRGESDDRPTGVWVGKAKIAAIGVRISRGATTHGFALNVDPDLAYFDRIVPCGMPDVPVTSMAAAGATVGVTDAARVADGALLRDHSALTSSSRGFTRSCGPHDRPARPAPIRRRRGPPRRPPLYRSSPGGNLVRWRRAPGRRGNLGAPAPDRNRQADRRPIRPRGAIVEPHLAAKARPEASHRRQSPAGGADDRHRPGDYTRGRRPGISQIARAARD